MPKKISPKIVNRYIEVDAQMDVLSTEQRELKERLRSFNEKGWESPLLRFQESSQWKPDWKKLVDELTTKYMNPAQKRVYYSKLEKRFPRKSIAPTIVIIGKERKSRNASDESSN